MRPTAGLATLLLAIAGYTLLLASSTTRRGSAAAGAVGLTILFQLIEVLANFWQPLQYVRWISPFHYFKPIAAATAGNWPPLHPTVLLLAFAVTSGAAIHRFRSQQL